VKNSWLNKTLVIIFMLGFYATSHADRNESVPYTFGVFPHLPPAQFAAKYKPLAKDFTRRLKQNVVMEAQKDYATFSEALRNEQYDIALVQSFDYVWAHDEHNYIPLVSLSKPMTAVFVVNKTSTIRQVSDLRGKKLVSPPQSDAVTKLTGLSLRKLGIAPRREFTHSEFSCLQQVLIGNADACATSQRALTYFDQHKMANRFRVIYKSAPIPHSVFVVHKRVTDTNKNIIKRTLLGLHKPKGFVVKPAEKFVETDDASYDVVRVMRQSLLTP